MPGQLLFHPGQVIFGAIQFSKEIRFRIMKANATRQIRLGGVALGGGAPVVVQSMTNTDTRDIEATVRQIRALCAIGCELARVAVPDAKAALNIGPIVARSPLPVIADVHFDWRLAIASMEQGVAGLRINPGNIGSLNNVNRIIDCARSNGVVIRIGVNSGSLEKDLLDAYGGPTPEALAQSALRYVRAFEDRGFENFKLSLKSSSVMNTVEAYRKIAAQCDYPLHIGVTEAGTPMRGTIKSSVALGILLSEGIGDTIRVSLTSSPEKEIEVAYQILAAVGLRKRGPEIISCPTCGRTEIDIISLAEAVESAVTHCALPLKIAVMGCVVNGPGEAREADIGLAGGRDKGIVFRKGKIVRSVNGYEALMKAFLAELETIINENTVN